MHSVFTFEKASVTITGNPTVAHFSDGSIKEYGNPFAGELTKMYDSIEAIRTGTTPICTVKTAVSHTKLVNAIYKNAAIVNFPAELKKEAENENRPYIDGLDEMLINAYEEGKLLSELNCSCARPYAFTIE